MLETEQCPKDEAALQQGRLASRQYQRHDEDSVHESVVLEMDVVDDEQPGR